MSEISHLFLSSLRERQADGTASPQRVAPRPAASIDMTPEEYQHAVKMDAESPVNDGSTKPADASRGPGAFAASGATVRFDASETAYPGGAAEGFGSSQLTKSPDEADAPDGSELFCVLHSHTASNASVDEADPCVGPGAESPRIKPLRLVVASHLGDEMTEHLLALAATRCQDGGRTGLIVLDAQHLRISCVERNPHIDSFMEEPLPDEIMDVRRMREALTELNYDVDEWLLVLPSPRHPEARVLLAAALDWTLLSTCDHEGVVSSYRALKGLCEGGLTPAVSLAVIQPVDAADAGRVTQKLQAVCRQFLTIDASAAETVGGFDDITEHVVLSVSAAQSRTQMAAAGQWQVVGEFVEAARLDNAPAQTPSDGPTTASDQPVTLGDGFTSNADNSIPLGRPPVMREVPQPPQDRAQDERKPARAPLRPASPNMAHASNHASTHASPALTPPSSHSTPIASPPPAVSVPSAAASSDFTNAAAGLTASDRAARPAPGAYGRPGQNPTAGTRCQTPIQSDRLTGDFAPVFELRDGATCEGILRAIVHGGGELVECPVRPPACQSAVVAVTRDRRLALLAVAEQGLPELAAIASAFRWMIENRPLLAMALPQFGLDPAADVTLRIFVDQTDLCADVLQPLLASGQVRVQAYRKLRWGDRTGLLLEAA